MKKPEHIEVITYGKKRNFVYDGLENIEITCPECDNETEDIKDGLYRKFLVLSKEDYSTKKGFVKTYKTDFILKCVDCNCVFKIVLNDDK